MSRDPKGREQLENESSWFCVTPRRAFLPPCVRVARDGGGEESRREGGGRRNVMVALVMVMVVIGGDGDDED